MKHQFTLQSQFQLDIYYLSGPEVLSCGGHMSSMQGIHLWFPSCPHSLCSPVLPVVFTALNKPPGQAMELVAFLQVESLQNVTGILSLGSMNYFLLLGHVWGFGAGVTTCLVFICSTALTPITQRKTLSAVSTRPTYLNHMAPFGSP